MARLTLTNGEGRLGIYHRNIEKDGKTRRGTEVIVDLPNGEQITTFAICSDNDRFTRKMGRKVAAERLLNIMRNKGVSYEDRRTVFQKICPEYK